MAEIVFVNPRFEVSFWGLEHALPLLGRRAAMPPASLALLAALTPPGHAVTLVDENVEAIDYDRCAAADMRAITSRCSRDRRTPSSTPRCAWSSCRASTSTGPTTPCGRPCSSTSADRSTCSST